MHPNKRIQREREREREGEREKERETTRVGTERTKKIYSFCLHSEHSIAIQSVLAFVCCCCSHLSSVAKSSILDFSSVPAAGCVACSGHIDSRRNRKRLLLEQRKSEEKTADTCPPRARARHSRAPKAHQPPAKTKSSPTAAADDLRDLWLPRPEGWSRLSLSPLFASPITHPPCPALSRLSPLFSSPITDHPPCPVLSCPVSSLR